MHKKVQEQKEHEMNPNNVKQHDLKWISNNKLSDFQRDSFVYITLRSTATHTPRPFPLTLRTVTARGGGIVWSDVTPSTQAEAPMFGECDCKYSPADISGALHVRQHCAIWRRTLSSELRVWASCFLPLAWLLRSGTLDCSAGWLLGCWSYGMRMATLFFSHPRLLRDLRIVINFATMQGISGGWN